MPSVPQGSLVLLTGASGFIAVHVLRVLLQEGYKVRGTVRSAEKGDWLVKKFPGGDFTYVIVEDLEKEGGFDDAVKGVDAVLHTASPFHGNVTTGIYEDLINPAVNGTKNVLKSIKAHGDKVKRVVITSSFAAVVNPLQKPVYTFTEKDWNEASPKMVEEQGEKVDPMQAYRTAKTWAEQAAWKFVEEEKPSWDLVTVNPPFVLGPIDHQVSKPESLNTSVAAWWAFLSGKKSGDEAQVPAGNEVDVRDLALAHVRAIMVQEAGSNRFAVSKQAFSWQDALDVANSNEEVKKAFPKLPVGKPGAGSDIKQNLFDASKSENVLKLQYTSFENTIIDMSLALAKRQAADWRS